MRPLVFRVLSILARSPLFTRKIGVQRNFHLHIPTMLTKRCKRLVQKKGFLSIVSYLTRLVPMGKGSFLVAKTDIGRIELPIDDRSATPLIIFGYLPHEDIETLYLYMLGLHSRTIVDIGAQYGWYCGLLAQQNPSAQVIAFEPDPQSYEYLHRNFSHLRNLIRRSEAISSRVGAATLCIAPARGLNSLVRQVGPCIAVQRTTLDTLFRSSEGKTIDLVKCDVEGGEVDVLIGARNLIRDKDAPIWMIEVVDRYLREAGRKPDDIIELLTSLSEGTFCYEISPSGTPQRVMRFRPGVHANIFVVPSDRRFEFERAAIAVERILNYRKRWRIGAKSENDPDRGGTSS